MTERQAMALSTMPQLPDGKRLAVISLSGDREAVDRIIGKLKNMLGNGVDEAEVVIL
jgi:hypothetical protein